MIASLHGRIDSLGSDWAIINVGGVGYRVYMPTSTLSAVGVTGKEAKLHTYLHVREDALTLYGFSSAEELDLFQTLMTVSGIGPRLALAMLSSMSAEQLATAIATGSADLLTAIPGIGKKTASRIILELKDKIGAGLLAAPIAQVSQDNTDVLSALTSLGYSVAEASRAVAALPTDSKLSLEEKVRLALGWLGGK
ncbi:MAG: Holliday junction branch migration protein RuvA [Chloroflexi bacterium]|nr:Holliday junction branch migration protein RuvA [Chloroflexota bacterium]